MRTASKRAGLRARPLPASSLPGRILRGVCARIQREQEGMILIEIVVSAMLLVIVALGVFTAFDAGTRATAEERHRARAQSIADGDVARMQSMRIAELVGLNATRTVTQDALNYSVRSRADFVSEPASTSTCASGTDSRDLLKVSSTVTWPSIGSRPPVSVTSIVAPPNGSVVPNSGSLLVKVDDSRTAPMSGVTLTGTGAGSFSGTTGTGGCVLWRNLPAGTYSMTVGGAAAGKVDVDGVAPSAQTVSVVAQSTNTKTLMYDSPGRVQNIGFNTRNYANALVASTADAVVLDNTGMTTARLFGTPGGTRSAAITTPTTLFPFTSPYSIYAGSCGDNNPGVAPMLGSATVPVGGTVTGPTLQLPSLLVTLWSGTSAASPGSPVSGGDVTAFDDNCNVQRTLTTSTNAQGQVPTAGNVGLPFSDDYEICANDSAQTGRRVISDFALTTAGATGTALAIYLGGTPGGRCP